MSLFNVSQEKCTKCGACHAVCPMKIIEFKQNSFPNPAKMADSLCINCGHCVCVCPTDALSHKNIPFDQCLPVQRELLPASEQVEHLILQRRSIRNFKEKTVDRHILGKIVNIARFAPSSRNTQSVYWVIVYEKDKVKRMVEMAVNFLRHFIKKETGNPKAALAQKLVMDFESGLDTICWNAPHLIVAHSPQSKNTAQTNCTIAMTHLELLASSFGLGTCWLGYFNLAVQSWPPLRNALNIPKDNIIGGSIVIGYAGHQYQRIPIRNEAEITQIMNN